MEKRGSRVGPQCAEPTPILDRYLLTVKDSELCPLPSVSSLQLSNIKPYSFLVTWDSPDTNMTGLKGFIVAYHRLDKNDQVRKFRLPPSIRGFNVGQVLDNTLYLVCVVTRGSSWRSSAGYSSNNVRVGALSSDEEYDDEEEDLQALEMLGFVREERDASEDMFPEQQGLFSSSTGDTATSDQIVLASDWDPSGPFFNATTVVPMTTIDYPSSNDSNLIVMKPTMVNLGSKSSKCAELRTPPDPAKLRFIDNKRMSIIIGCVSGVLVFIMIILCIVTHKDDDKEEENESTHADSLSGSHKSPGSKTARSDSLNFTGATPGALAGGHRPPPAAAVGRTRTNSQSSSLLANRISLAETTPEAGRSTLRNTQQPPSASGTLRRGTLSRQHSDANQPSSLLQKQQSHSSSGGRLMSKQSSTESGPSSSNRLSRQSSSETNAGGPTRRCYNEAYQSWHGTPRADASRRSGDLNTHSQRFNDRESYSTTLPRRSAEHHQRLHGSLDKRRSAGNNDPSAIPLIEYHLVENGSHNNTRVSGGPTYAVPDRAVHNLGGSGGARPKVTMNDNVRRSYVDANHIGPPPPIRMGNHVNEAEESIDYYPSDSRGAVNRQNKPYIKYNSFANY